MKKTHSDEKSLVIRDELHGDMVFELLVRSVIDHECFQRLRSIKQVGLAEYVFPSATHTRFQHSLGACYVAGEYFKSLFDSWMSSPFEFDGRIGTTEFRGTETKKLLESVLLDDTSHLFWRRVCTLAALLHDIGHGPWSHTFEYLQLPQDFRSTTSQMTGTLGKYFLELAEKGESLHHEDISVIYIFHILKDLTELKQVAEGMQYFLPVIALANSRLLKGEQGGALEKELEVHLEFLKIKGGLDMHRLLRPLISGPFDVDRIDYIQRDGRNCGVLVGGIEWRRIVSKLLPCLARHRSERQEPSHVVLVSSHRNHNVLDDFTFSLFQMYAQIYLHPKIVGIEEVGRQLLAERKPLRKQVVVDFNLHRTLTDEKFRDLLCEGFGVPEMEQMLRRKRGFTYEIVSSPQGSGMDETLRDEGFQLIDNLERPMMKESAGVFLYTPFWSRKEAKKTYLVEPWVTTSPVARHFYSINYSPKIWIRKETD